MPKRFLRRQGNLLLKFSRKKKQKWRRPTGRDNKMREKRKGRPAVVSIGYKKPKSEAVKIIRSVAELEKFKGKKIIVGKVGKKKRMEIEKIAKEKKIEIVNSKKLKNSEEKNESKI